MPISKDMHSSVYRCVPSDSAYPDLLKHIADPPQQLFVRGNIHLLRKKCIAVIGTRAMTEYGRLVVKQFVPELVRHGYVIVSGLAYGVDITAHLSALQEGGETIAVLPGNIHSIVPSAHTSIATEILQKGGALVSEYSTNIAQEKYVFVKRNRIIAGLSKAIVVIEAGTRSGTHITAGYAAEYGIPVCAVPGPITNPFSEGTKALVNEGAVLVSSVKDILMELGVTGNLESKSAPSDPQQLEILKHLQSNPELTLHELSELTSLAYGQTALQVMRLELDGWVSTLQGKVRLVCVPDGTKEKHKGGVIAVKK